MLSAIIYGLRISLSVSFISVSVAVLIGLVMGMLAAWRGGWVDSLIMRIVDIQLSFPALLVALLLLAALGKGVDKVILALIIVLWAYFARTVRGAALVEIRKDYITAARSQALPGWRILFGHLLPNVMPPVIVIATVQIANAISIEAALSFLGVGVPITEPSLGLLIANGFDYLLSGRYWISFYPGIALLLTLVCINVVGDQIRDILNPRMQR
jgi:peptide/nickel transport system permease protein